MEINGENIVKPTDGVRWWGTGGKSGKRLSSRPPVVNQMEIEEEGGVLGFSFENQNL